MVHQSVCRLNCDSKLLKMSKNVITASDNCCVNVILLVYLYPKNVIYAKKKDRERSS